MKLRLPLVLALAIFNQPVLSQWVCDFRVYGRPQLEHCVSALNAMPDATAKMPTPKLAAMRKFVEPQYLDPPFSECQNGLEGSMEQLPKFWRYKSCRFVLTPLPTPSGKVLNPRPASTWSYILHNAQKVSERCMGRKLGGGVIFIADPGGDGAMGLYVYAVGSAFEALLNNYMITSQPIFPPGIDSTTFNNDSVLSLSQTTTKKNGTYLGSAWHLQNANA